MFDYSPKLPELIFYPVLGGLIAHGFSRAFPSDVMTLFEVAIYINCAFVGSFYLWRESCKYVDGQAHEKPSTPAPMAGPVKQYLNLNTSDDKPIYSQNMPRMKIDCVGRFNKILIDQRNGNLKVDMSEGFWLKLRDGMEETEWKRIGGQGPTEFRNMLERGQRFGAYKRDGGQGKWVPYDWQKVRRLAKGEPLPQ